MSSPDVSFYSTHYSWQRAIYSWDYHPDEATGPNFKFVEISLISNPIFKSFNGENIKVGQNVHIKAKVGGYNEKQDLVFLSPIEVSPR